MKLKKHREDVRLLKDSWASHGGSPVFVEIAKRYQRLILCVERITSGKEHDMDLKERIREAINCTCAENGSDTPDFILAEYLTDCLAAFDKATTRRTRYFAPTEDGKKDAK